MIRFRRERVAMGGDEGDRPQPLTKRSERVGVAQSLGTMLVTLFVPPFVIGFVAWILNRDR